MSSGDEGVVEIGEFFFGQVEGECLDNGYCEKVGYGYWKGDVVGLRWGRKVGKNWVIFSRFSVKSVFLCGLLRKIVKMLQFFVMVILRIKSVSCFGGLVICGNSIQCSVVLNVSGMRLMKVMVGGVVFVEGDGGC